ncbi:MAG: LysR substrate-binding domain-containing protein [Hyphomonadaceae bacterium]
MRRPAGNQPLLHHRDVRPSFSLRTLSDDRAMSMVAAGLGVTVAPSSFKAPGLASVNLAGFDLSRDVGLVFSDRMRDRGGAFVEAARATYSSHGGDRRKVR